MAMMTKDRITTFALRPSLAIDPEFRLSPYWIIATLVCLEMISLTFSLEKPLELTEARDVYIWVSHDCVVYLSGSGRCED